MTILVLGGGGLWSLAGIGAAKALGEMGVSIDGYVGSSAGSLVAALLAMGYAPETLKEFAETIRRRDFRVPWWQWARTLVRGRIPQGVLDERRFWGRISATIPDWTWPSLGRPLAVVTTSLTHRQPVVFGTIPPVSREGGYHLHLSWQGERLPLINALHASMAVPGLFSPIEWEQELLADGGILDDFPIDVAAWLGADRIIGVWVDEPPVWTAPRGFHAGHVASSSVAAMIRELSIIRQRHVLVPHLVIRVEMTGGHRVFNRVASIIDQGYRVTHIESDNIARLIDRRA